MKDDTPEPLKERTKQFALEVIRCFVRLPHAEVARVLGRQLLRSRTSVRAQEREGKRAKSNEDMIRKMEGALQEREESCYWVELLAEGGGASKEESIAMLTETNELIAIFVTVVKNAKRR